MSMVIISDFDGTITYKDSISTIGLFNMVFPQYKEELKRIRFELSKLNLSSEIITLKYAKEELKLLSKYLKNYDIDDSLYELFKIRDGFKDLISFTKEKRYEFIISSSGIGNVISKVLTKNEIDSEFIKIIANYYNFNYEFNFSDIIYSRKKYNEYILKKKNEGFVLIGNHPSDRNMLPLYINPLLSIGFNDKEIKCFDYTLSDSASFDDVIRLIKKV